MDYNLLKTYGILILVLIFFIINIYYKNIINILIFLVLFLLLRIYITDINSIIGAYILVLLYGITKNFHLMENFITNNNNSKLNELLKQKILLEKQKILPDNSLNENSPIQTPDNPQPPKNPQPQIPKKQPTKSINNENNKELDIESIISEELINQFIEKIKEIDDLLIIKTKKNIYNLKPILKKISKNKVEKMKINAIHKDSGFITKPIVISNDNFILDGHHRWFARKTLIENNINGFSDKLYSERVDVVVIDFGIKTLIRKLQEFKIKFNTKVLSSKFLDKNKVDEGIEYINNIKENLRGLEDNYNELNKMKLV